MPWSAAAAIAPSTISAGAWSPPIASTAMVGGAEGYRVGGESSDTGAILRPVRIRSAGPGCARMVVKLLTPAPGPLSRRPAPAPVAAVTRCAPLPVRRLRRDRDAALWRGGLRPGWAPSSASCGAGCRAGLPFLSARQLQRADA